VISRRAARRLLRHHLPLAALSLLASLGIVWLLRDAERAVFRWSMATGYVGLALLAATLLPGARAALRGRRYPVSTDLRRDIGAWAALFSVAHFLVGWQVHMRHRSDYFLTPGAGGILLPRVDLFGIANWIGLAAVAIALLLLAISSDAALRRIGAERWKGLQRWNVTLFALVVLHAALYVVMEERGLAWIVAGALLAGSTAALRLAGRRRRRALAAGGDATP
jgi:sulfoxide reductase heme-binding subunit YedZ